MALILEEKRKFNWGFALTVSIVSLVIVGGAYLLFFTSAPAIEIIVPPSVRSVSELSAVQFDPSAVVNSEQFRSLRRYAGQPSVGQIGRVNPFVKF